MTPEQLIRDPRRWVERFGRGGGDPCDVAELRLFLRGTPPVL